MKKRKKELQLSEIGTLNVTLVVTSLFFNNYFTFFTQTLTAYLQSFSFSNSKLQRKSFEYR